MKRTLLAVLIAAAVFGGVYGLAASMGVSSGALGSGSDSVVSCQSAPISVGYTPTYVQASGGYDATTVTIGGLESTCLDKDIKVALSDGSDASLAEQTDTTPLSGTSKALTFSGVSASDVEGVHVTISG